MIALPNVGCFLGLWKRGFYQLNEFLSLVVQMLDSTIHKIAREMRLSGVLKKLINYRLKVLV